jgi:hypothetical protein
MHTRTHCLAIAESCFVQSRDFAWNHGDFQREIVRTWLGVVGPGIRNLGRTDALFTDHADIRPTILSLARLSDDYAHDGRVIFEIIRDDALPASLRGHGETLSELAEAYKRGFSGYPRSYGRPCPPFTGGQHGPAHGAPGWRMFLKTGGGKSLKNFQARLRRTTCPERDPGRAFPGLPRTLNGQFAEGRREAAVSLATKGVDRRCSQSEND